MNTTKHLKSLRTRIYGFCCILVAFCVLSTGVGWWGQSRLLANFDAYENTEQTSASVLQIDRNVQELKSRSENYLHTGSESQHRSAVSLQVLLLAEIEEVKQQTESPDLVEILGEMTLHIETFGDQLALAANERALRTQLVQQILPTKGDEVQHSVIEFQSAIADSQTAQARSNLLDAVQSFAFARKNLLQYFNNPRTEDFQRMLVSVNRAIASVEKYEVQEEMPDLFEKRETLRDNLLDFKQAGIRAVQATRGYLYYSNVVMAAEVSEFVYYSKRLKTFVESQQNRNRERRQVAAVRSRNLGIVASLLAVVLASLLATRLSFSIVSPISQLTETFQRLSCGETIAEIPASGRSDEIGRMAQAAKVFSEKNLETGELLQRARDLTSELETKAQLLEASNKELDSFAYVASHDLKSPLRGINSLAQWVQEDCAALLPAESRKHLEQMQGRVLKMETLLNDLLEYSRVGREGKALEHVHVADMVQSIMEITDNPNEVKLGIDGELPELVTCRTPLQQVMMNLIANAINYNDKGTNGRVEVSCKDAGDSYCFSVADNGIGIPSKYHDRIFQLYQRVSASKLDGSGMGLAIVKKQLEQFGGSITVESRIGEGATFAFKWPKRLESKLSARDRGTDVRPSMIQVTEAT